MSGLPTALREPRLRQLLKGEPFVERLIVVDTVDSTNAELRSLAARGAAEGTVLLADHQSAGRGRHGRAWHSPRGSGLYLSVLFRPLEPPAQLTRWTLAAAVAACRACRRLGGEGVTIEWPNDIVWQGKKLGGVLAETRSVGDRPGDLIVGIGLNVHQDVPDFPDELCSSATSLRLAAGGAPPDREMLAALCLGELADLSLLLKSGDWREVARRWERLAPGARGRRVRVVGHRGAAVGYEGETRGLDDSGALRVSRDDGEIESVRLAESVLSLEDRPCC